MNRFVWKCVIALFGVACVACDYSPICPAGYQYDNDERVCLGDAGPPPVDAGNQNTDVDAGAPEDAGAEEDASVEADATVSDAEIENDGGTEDAS
jgi:hypothetical protein